MLTLNGMQLPRVTIQFAKTGAWLAECSLPADEAPAGAASIAFGAVTLKGTIRRSSLLGGEASVPVVGGAGGMQRLATPQYYKEPLAARIFVDLCGAAGEEPSPDALADVLPGWVTRRETVGSQLNDLAKVLGVDWWIDDGGSVRLGARALEAPTSERTLFEDNASQGQRVYVASEMDLRPGMLLDGKVLGGVVYEITGAKSRAIVEVK